jgi:hypothetical protein
MRARSIGRQGKPPTWIKGTQRAYWFNSVEGISCKSKMFVVKVALSE